jgi:hypothetical protein
MANNTAKSIRRAVNSLDRFTAFWDIRQLAIKAEKSK